MADANANLDQFFQNSDLTPESLKEIVTQGLEGADYGEFYQEIVESEQLVKDKGTYSSVSAGNKRAGFGFRVGQGENVGYSYSPVFNEASLKGAVSEARQVLDTQKSFRERLASGLQSLKNLIKTTPEEAKTLSSRVDMELYQPKNPILDMTLEEKVAKIDELEAFVKELDPAIKNVTISYSAKSQAVHVMTADGNSMTDIRPMASLAISVMVADDEGNLEQGTALVGGRGDLANAFNKESCEKAAHKALNLAKTLLVAEDAPAGTMDVVLSAGWPAVLLHEAVGHGMEGDFNYKNISVYSGKVGQKVAGPEVTIVDQGDMPGERGSLHFDDEGVATQENLLVENGILKGYMHDRQSAQQMEVAPTGNGRRESYEHLPMPRMTNTYFRAGPHDPEDIIKSVKDGLYISDMGGGQVDITSGKFNMVATLAYRIRDGKICEPVKGATLTGDGLSVIESITMVGNDLEIEKSAGMCGKNGQSLPVSCGQPTIRVSNMTIGGTK